MPAAGQGPHPVKARIVNLLDDVSLGGVTRALGVFATPTLQAVAESRTVAVAPGGIMPPRDAADVFIIHFTVSWKRLLFLMLLRLTHRQARIILVEHSYTRAFEAQFVRHRGRFRLMLRMAARLVDAVVCVSHAQARWLGDAAAIAPDRIAVIHPYVANPGLATVPLPQPDPGRPLRIGAYGRFCLQKGFDVVVRGFHAGHFGDAQLILGGFGEDEAQLRALADGSPQIHFTGKVDDVAAFLAGVDVVAIPSRWEAYGMVANEAREAGRPILVAPCDGLPEQTSGAGGTQAQPAGLVVDFADPAAIAGALARLTPPALVAMGQAGRASTADCGPARERQWAALISRLGSAGRDQRAGNGAAR